MKIESVSLSVQTALLGNITPNLRAVYIIRMDEVICLTFYYDFPPSDNEQELASLTDTEFISDFPDENTDCRIITLSYPKPLPKNGECIYLRYEKPTEIPSFKPDSKI